MLEHVLAVGDRRQPGDPGAGLVPEFSYMINDEAAQSLFTTPDQHLLMVQSLPSGPQCWNTTSFGDAEYALRSAVRLAAEA